MVSVSTTKNYIVVSGNGSSITVSSESPRITISEVGVQGAVGNAGWGAITGDINNQTDLQNQFDTKADKDDLYVIGLADSGAKDITGLPDNIIYSDYLGVTNNTKTFIYSSGVLTQTVQVFDYNSENWTVTVNYTSSGGNITNISSPVVIKA